MKSLVDDSYRPPSVTGFINSGWAPPPSVSEEVKNLLPETIAACERALVPATHEEATIILVHLATLCCMEGMTKATWKVRLKNFIEYLDAFPPDILEATCRQWCQKNKFWPAISEFLKLAEPLLKKRHRIARRLRTLQRVAETPAPDNEVEFGWYLKVTSDRNERRLNG